MTLMSLEKIAMELGVVKGTTQALAGEVRSFKKEINGKFDLLSKDVRANTGVKWKAAGGMGTIVAIMEMVGQYFRMK